MCYVPPIHLAQKKTTKILAKRLWLLSEMLIYDLYPSSIDMYLHQANELRRPFFYEMLKLNLNHVIALNNNECLS